MRALALLLALFAAGSAAAQGESFEARLRAEVARDLARRHMNPEHVPAERILAEAAKARDQGIAEDSLLEGVPGLVDAAFFSFAPRGARHASGTRYRLPFDPMVPRLLVQGVAGPYTHREEPSYYAFDFAIPPGGEILAARAGVVARVIDGFDVPVAPSSRSPDDVEESNAVYVLHPDGTFAGYRHLRRGSAAREGQSVATGTLLGWSGESGGASGPLLHFAVNRFDERGRRVSVPIRFGEDGSPGHVPQQGRAYGHPPSPTVPLEVAFEGRPVSEQAALLLARGGRGHLSVALVRDGTRRDVSRDPATRYDSLTPWSVVVDSVGEVRMVPGPGYERSPDESRDVGRIQVLYVDRTRGEIGRVVFDLRTGR